MAKIVNTSKWGRETARQRYADGGKSWAVKTTSQDPSDVKEMQRVGPKHMVAPYSQQEFNDQSSGPLNITPSPIPMDKSRKHGGKVKSGKMQAGGSAPPSDSDDLLSKVPSDLGPLEAPALHPGSTGSGGVSSLYFPGNPDEPYSKRWLISDGRMLIRRPGLRKRGGKVK